MPGRSARRAGALANCLTWPQVAGNRHEHRFSTLGLYCSVEARARRSASRPQPSLAAVARAVDIGFVEQGAHGIELTTRLFVIALRPRRGRAAEPLQNAPRIPCFTGSQRGSRKKRPRRKVTLIFPEAFFS